MVTYKLIDSVDLSKVDPNNLIICDDIEEMLSKCLKYEIYYNDTFHSYLIFEGTNCKCEVAVHFMIGMDSSNALVTYNIAQQVLSIIKELVSDVNKIRAVIPITRPKIVKLAKMLGFQRIGREDYIFKLGGY